MRRIGAVAGATAAGRGDTRLCGCGGVCTIPAEGESSSRVEAAGGAVTARSRCCRRRCICGVISTGDGAASSTKAGDREGEGEGEGDRALGLEDGGELASSE